MAADPLVTVVTPCRNHGRYLAECAASVRAQTLAAWDWTIVDDGSDDGRTAGIVAALADPPRVLAVRTPGLGLSAARNRGADGARGEFLFFLDADDRIEPDALARLVAALREHPDAAFAYSSTRTFGANDVLWPHATYNAWFERFANGWEPAVLVRRGVYAESGGFSPVGGGYGYEDWDFWVRLAAAGHHGVHVPAPLLRYRVKASSMVTVARAHHDELVAALRAKNPAAYDGAALLATKRRWSPAVSLVVDRPPDLGAIRRIEETFLDFEVCRRDGTVLWPIDGPPHSLRPEPVLGKVVIAWDGTRDPGLAADVARRESSPRPIADALDLLRAADVPTIARLAERSMRRSAPAWFGTNPPASPDEIDGPTARLRLFQRRAAANGWTRTAWFGGGHFARRLLAVPGVRPPDCVLDDAPPGDLDVPARAPDPRDAEAFDAILICADTTARDLGRRAARLWPDAPRRVHALVY
jgi:glycosyltransferase involved in cell wall biosynthesis